MPLVSVIIPAYNQARYLGEAIQSVLDQTMRDFELIVVNDGSTDETGEIASAFTDDRLQVIHQENRGLPAARNTGLAAASGKFICFLDSDDAYLPNKLERQTAHLQNNEQIGVSFAGNIVIDPGGTPLWLSGAKPAADLKALLLGFPFNINDIMIRRESIERVGGFDESYRLHGEDRPFYSDLAMSGAQFVGIPEFLSLRRLYPNRKFSDIPGRLSIMLRALQRSFDNLEKSERTERIKAEAMAGLHMSWALQAYVQSESELGSSYLLEAIRLNPSLTVMEGLPICRELVWANVRSASDYVATLPSFFLHLPPELVWLKKWEAWCYGQNHFLLGTSHIIWDRRESARGHFLEAKALGFVPDKVALNRLVVDVLNLRLYLGADECRRAQLEIEPVLKVLGGSAAVRHVRGRLAFNLAQLNYRDKAYSKALKDTTRAITADPGFALNRGLMSVTARSMWHLVSTGTDG